jgi:hypothetical protein
MTALRYRTTQFLISNELSGPVLKASLSKATTPQTWQVASSETKPRYPQTLSKTLQMLMRHCGKKKSYLTTFFFHAFSGDFSPEFLSIFRIAYRWGDPKPRLCVDPSTTITPTDIGNVNHNITDPGVDEDQNPTIYYGTALQRYLQWLYNL